MNIKLNENYLITTNNWFTAPDGNSYKSVFGKVTSILDDNESLGIKTNRGSTNWYVNIGNMLVAGCQIHYVIKTDEVNLKPNKLEIQHEGKINLVDGNTSLIYNANIDYSNSFTTKEKEKTTKNAIGGTIENLQKAMEVAINYKETMNTVPAIAKELRENIKYFEENYS